MKQFFMLILAAALGSALTLFFLGPSTASSPPPVLPTAPVQLVNYPPQEPVPGFNFTEAAEQAMPAVVHISATSSGGENDPFRFFFGEKDNELFEREGFGSGVIYTEDGYIVTNNHVIEEASKIEVTLFDNRRFTAVVVGTDQKTDLAVLKIEASELPTLDLADSDRARIGEWVLAVGNPLDLTSTVTAGIISAKGRSLELLEDRDAIESFIQTDAAVNPGNSGGALVDQNGRLLGINTAIATKTGLFQGYSFAIPVNLVVRIANDIIQYGAFQRAFLGVNIYPLDAEAAAELNVSINQGVVIEEILENGSAQAAGLLPQDVIIRVNARKINDVPDLTEIIGRSKVGETLNITVLRKNRELSIPVQLRPEP